MPICIFFSFSIIKNSFWVNATFINHNSIKSLWFGNFLYIIVTFEKKKLLFDWKLCMTIKILGNNKDLAILYCLHDQHANLRTEVTFFFLFNRECAERIFWKFGHRDFLTLFIILQEKQQQQEKKNSPLFINYLERKMSALEPQITNDSFSWKVLKIPSFNFNINNKCCKTDSI